MGAGEAALVKAFLAAAHELDVPSMERILDEGFASQRFELAIESLVSPALRADRRSRGPGMRSMSAPNTQRARRSGADWRASTTPRASAIGRHVWSSACLPTATTRSGHSPSLSPQDEPGSTCSISVRMCRLRAWLRTVRETAAPVVVLGVVTPSDVVAAGAVVDALSISPKPPRICLVGGPLSAASLDGLRTIRLPIALDDAVAAVVGLLGSGERSVR